MFAASEADIFTFPPIGKVSIGNVCPKSTPEIIGILFNCLDATILAMSFSVTLIARINLAITTLQLLNIGFEDAFGNYTCEPRT